MLGDNHNILLHFSSLSLSLSLSLSCKALTTGSSLINFSHVTNLSLARTSFKWVLTHAPPLPPYLSLSLSVYIYIYICVCVCSFSWYVSVKGYMYVSCIQFQPLPAGAMLGHRPYVCLCVYIYIYI
ncbi:hypothetical protein Ahia01_000805100, partial [Argonauta hians]